MSHIHLERKSKLKLKRVLNSVYDKKIRTLTFNKVYSAIHNLAKEYFDVNSYSIIQSYIDDVFSLQYSYDYGSDTEKCVTVYAKNMNIGFDNISFYFVLHFESDYCEIMYDHGFGRSVISNLQQDEGHFQSGFIENVCAHYKNTFTCYDYASFFNNFMKRNYSKKQYIKSLLPLSPFAGTLCYVGEMFDGDDNIEYVTMLVTNPKVLKNMIVIIKILIKNMTS